MRSLNLTLAFLSIFLVLATKNAGAAGQTTLPVTGESIREYQEAVEYLFNDVERLQILGKTDGCDDLNPIPLSVGAPSVESWITYCHAIVERNADLCKMLPAMIDPDLRTRCFSALNHDA